MNKFLLSILFVAALAALEVAAATVPADNNETYSPMLVEGRTWWYNSTHRLYGHPDRSLIAENGVSVGEEVEIDGVKWRKINVVMTGFYDARVGWTYDNSVRTIAYMREENGRIYTAYFDGFFECPGLEDYQGDFTRGESGIQLSYEYLEPGESYVMGDSDLFATIKIDDIVTVRNSGKDYTMYKATSDIGQEMNYIKGIGHVERAFYDPLSQGVTALNVFQPPVLRYVTDPDGGIIYEALGGYKLWERDAIENVRVETEDSYRWYNLQGVEIAQPASPGIYIRSGKTGSEKIMVR